MNASLQPLGYQVLVSVSDSEGVTADFTLANTSIGTEIVAACDFPIPNDALAFSLLLAARAVMVSANAMARTAEAANILAKELQAEGSRMSAGRNKRPAATDGDMPF